MAGRSRLGLVTIVLFATFQVFAYSCAFNQAPHRGEKVLESWETSYTSFSVRVKSYDEAGGYPSGAYYVFESALADSNVNWREFMVFRHDEWIAIPHTNIRLLNERVGYVFIGWKYAVTIDGGRSWHVWDAQKDLPDWSCCNYRLIRDVSLTDSGDGDMFLNPIPQRRGEVPLLHTEDFGKHWTSK